MTDPPTRYIPCTQYTQSRSMQDSYIRSGVSQCQENLESRPQAIRSHSILVLIIIIIVVVPHSRPLRSPPVIIIIVVVIIIDLRRGLPSRLSAPTWSP
jgi:hypothetical protein